MSTCWRVVIQAYATALTARPLTARLNRWACITPAYSNPITVCPQLRYCHIVRELYYIVLLASIANYLRRRQSRGYRVLYITLFHRQKKTVAKKRNKKEKEKYIHIFHRCLKKTMHHQTWHRTMFHNESWKPIYFGSKSQRSWSQITKALPVWVFALLWVLAATSLRAKFCAAYNFVAAWFGDD